MAVFVSHLFGCPRRRKRFKLSGNFEQKPVRKGEQKTTVVFLQSTPAMIQIDVNFLDAHEKC